MGWVGIGAENLSRGDLYPPALSVGDVVDSVLARVCKSGASGGRAGGALCGLRSVTLWPALTRPLHFPNWMELRWPAGDHHRTAAITGEGRRMMHCRQTRGGDQLSQQVDVGQWWAGGVGIGAEDWYCRVDTPYSTVGCACPCSRIETPQVF